MWEGTLTLATGERNQEITTAIPIGGFCATRNRAFTLSPPSRSVRTRTATRTGPRNGWWSPDIGLFTLRGDDGLHVFARSLAGAKPLLVSNCGCTPATMANWAGGSPTAKVMPGLIQVCYVAPAVANQRR